MGSEDAKERDGATVMPKPGDVWVAFRDAPDLPGVYGIADKRDMRIVYVGRAKSVLVRMRAYVNPKICHNPMLADWLIDRGENAGMVLLSNGDDGDTEAAWIEKLKPQLFNMVRGGEQNWRSFERKPWMAKTGVRCPSSMAWHHLKRSQSHLANDPRILEFLDWLKTLSDKERCVVECDIGKFFTDKMPGFTSRVDKWCREVAPRMIAVMEAPDG